MNKYILIAEPGERRLIEHLTEKISGLEYLLELPVFVTGVGPLNVIDTFNKHPYLKEGEIFNIGYAGSNTLPMRKFYEVSTCHLHHPNVDCKSRTHNKCMKFMCGLLPTAPCYSNTDFVLSAEIKEPCLFDMEAAFICGLAKENCFCSIKFVSDNLSLKEYRESATESNNKK